MFPSQNSYENLHTSLALNFISLLSLFQNIPTKVKLKTNRQKTKKTKNAKTKQNVHKHRVCFVLVKYYWAWGLSSSDIYPVTLYWRKLTSVLLQITSWFECEPVSKSPPQYWDPIWFEHREALCTSQQSLWAQLSCWVWKTLFPYSPPHHIWLL